MGCRRLRWEIIMNILIACDVLLSGKGGMERLAVELANTMQKHYNVVLVYTEPGNNSYSIDSNIKPLLIDLNDKMDAVEKLLEFDINVYIYFCTNHKLVDHIFIAKELSSKIIISESASPMRINYNNWLSDGIRKPLKSAYERYSALSIVDKIRVEVEESLNYFPGFLKDKLQYFPNGTQYAGNKAFAKQNLNTKRLLIVGASKPHKRFDVALKALNKMVNTDEDRDIVLVVAGELKEKSKYVQSCLSYIKEHDLEKNIEFLGVMDNMDSVYAQCDIHLMCSPDESFGLVTIESMCFGLPTVGCYQSIGTRHLVKHNYNGLLYDDVEDYIELSSLIKKTLDDSTLYEQLSSNAVLSSQLYTDEEYYSNWKTMIEETFNSNNLVKKTLIEDFLSHLTMHSRDEVVSR